MTKQGKMNRRDFLKIGGIAGVAAVAGTAAAPAAAPKAGTPGKFSDPAGRAKRAWWVRTVEKPTIEIDWDKVQRFPEKYDPKLKIGTTRGDGFAAYVGDKARADAMTAAGKALAIQKAKDNVPGYTLRDQALYGAFGSRVGYSFLGNTKIVTPKERGLENWKGTPEEAAKMLRVVMRHLGAAHVAFVPLDEKTQKLIYSVDPDGKEIILENSAGEPKETEKQRIIPIQRFKWFMVWTVQMSEETLKRAPAPLGAATTAMTYTEGVQMNNQMQDFLRGIGYWGLAESSLNALAIAPALGVMGGLGEMSRLNRMISPEFGPMVRVFKMIIDLPVATDKPINAGIMEFCKSCKKCAEACPSSALSFETEPSWEVKGGWSNPGHKAYYEDSLKCRTYWQEAATNCGVCFSVCPFAKKDQAWIHQWVKGGIAYAPVLNSTFRSMDDAMGYGTKDASLWWELDLPEHGRDSKAPTTEG
jgi:epoxyqueuosine reductase